MHGKSKFEEIYYAPSQTDECLDVVFILQELFSVLSKLM